MSCLFCAIIAGDEPASIVLETDDVVGFLDIRPVFKGHVLVLPRSHHETLVDLPAPLLEPLFAQVQRLSHAVLDGLDAHGTFVAMNNVVSQSVPHAHVHVVPRRRKDGLRGFFWPRTRYENAAEAETFAERVRDALKR
ncbi:MAG: HIT family protein [Nocardioidaceae bacterium]|nr:HIT family protein [Nocardioidaceae bacterium]